MTTELEKTDTARDSLASVLLKPGDADRIVAGHPWIYHGSIQRLSRPAVDGEWVQVKDHRHRFIGCGFYNSKSKINVRVLTFEKRPPDTAFFEERFRAALAVRQTHLPGATSFRLVNAESDLLSGLIIDKYEEAIVIQTSALGMDQRKELILEALGRVLKLGTVIERNELSFRKFEGLPDANGVLRGEIQGPVTVRLNGLAFAADLLAGHKTGLYLDQQVNYRRVAEHAKGKRVLDCFSFAGGFGVHAAAAGALQVHMVDQSAEAIRAAEGNAKANGVSDVCTFEVGNVFDWLKAATTVGPHEKLVPKWDLIILDPPSFTRNRGRHGCAARLQGNSPARAETPEARKHPGHLLLLTSRGCQFVPGYGAFRGFRCAANAEASSHFLAVS
jgi:23S rRNA (cytosine1962-C5)-methyltransferase